jgi:excisionase family DNA binding protein
MFNGQPLYNKALKEMSLRQAAKLLGVHEQHLYYLVKKGRLPHVRRGAAIVLSYDELQKMFTPKQDQMRFA